MSILKCKMCGGSMEIRPGQSVAVCEYCGTMQTLPKLDSERIAALYERAELLRRSNDFDKAAAVYEQIVSSAPTDAEAYWSLVLCRYGIEYVEDPASHKRVPTINRIQYGSVLDDADYLSALQHADTEQKSVYEAEARAIEAIQKGFLAISMREKPFDVFICYKETDANGRRTPDSVLANDLYHQLTQEGFKVFFSRITLEDKLGAEYEPYIFAALNSSQVMVVMGTKAEYFNAPWVRNEWSRFLILIKNGEAKTLIPAYRDMNPYDLPEEFAQLQALDMSRLGFMQDLIRGIKKITGKEITVVPVAQTAATTISPLLRRAFLFLEDGNWKSANEYCEKVLDQEPENGRAYLGLLMIALKVRKEADLPNQPKPFDDHPLYEKAVRFSDAALLAELTGYNQTIRDRIEAARLEAERLEQERQEELRRKAEEERLRKEEEKRKKEEARLQAQQERERKRKEAEKRRLAELAAIQAQREKAAEEKRQAAAAAAAEKQRRAEAAAQKKAAEQQAKKEAAAAAAAEKQRRAEATAQKKAAEQQAKKEAAAAAATEKQRQAEAAAQKKAAEQQAKQAAAEAICLEKEQHRQTVQQARKEKQAAAKKKLPKQLLVACAAVLVIGGAVLGSMKWKAAKEAAALEAERLVVQQADEEAAAQEAAKQASVEAAYASALQLMDEKKYEEAAAAFAALGDYRDAADRVPEAKYLFAETLLAAQDYAGAASAFEALGDYRDCASRVPEVRYQHADARMAAEDYAGAAAAFAELGDYEDAASRVTEANYQHAISLLSAQDYKTAAPLLAELGDYKDAAEQVQAAWYESGKLFLQEKNMAEAALAFGKAGDYSDARAQSMACWDTVADRKCIAARSDTVGLHRNGTVAAINHASQSISKVSRWKDIISVDTGYQCFVGLRADGTVVKMDTTDRSDETLWLEDAMKWRDIVDIDLGIAQEWVGPSIGNTAIIGLRSDGTLVSTSTLRPSPAYAMISDWNNIIAIDSNGAHLVGLCVDGTVVSTQVDVSAWRDIVCVSAGEEHVVGLRADGTVVAEGSNHFGQCDVSAWSDVIAIAAGAHHTVGLCADGTVVATGRNDAGQCEVSDWKNISYIAAGAQTTVGVYEDGTAVAVGPYGDIVSDWSNIGFPESTEVHKTGTGNGTNNTEKS